MEHKVILQNESIETAGYKKDYKAAIIEYIWNSLEAQASHVNVNISSNTIAGVDAIQIVDNGDGIDFDNLDKTFGTFLYSQKNEYAESARGKRNKGKGRYSFLAIASNAKWETKYKKDNKIFTYSLEIESSKKDFFSVSNLTKSDGATGTTVTISGGIELVNDDFGKEFEQILLKEFSWFLFLNRSKDFYIAINGKKLDYSGFIDSSLSQECTILLDEYKFTIHFIKWIEGINQKYFYYFMDNNFHEKRQEHTKFNNNAIGFFHSVYVLSEYFDDFVEIDSDENQQNLFLKSPKHEVYKELLKRLHLLMIKKQKEFLKIEVPKVIKGFEREGAFPSFAANKYDDIRKQDLVTVVEEVYSIQPRIFYKAPIEQKKTVIGFLNLLLDTDERENIILIIDSITELTKEERKSLASVLRKTSLRRIIATIKLIENRYTIIESLKKIIFENGKYSSERAHIQSAIEQNYWLFGEQYNLVSADDSFEKALKEYRYRILGEQDKTQKIENDERQRRPDIFMCRSRIVEDSKETQLEENIIVELKSPSIVLNKEVYRQIEDYMELITKEKQFRGDLRKWKFIAVCCTVADEIQQKYEAFSHCGKRFLVYKQGNFEIYAMTWADVFKSFDLRHHYLLDKLKYQKSILLDELNVDEQMVGREKSNNYYKKITEINLQEIQDEKNDRVLENYVD